MKKFLLLISAIAIQLTAMAATWTLNGSSYTVTTTSTTDLGAGTVVTKATVTNGSHVMRIFYSVTDLTNPSVAVRTVAAGSKLTTVNSVKTMASSITDATPLVGINGGFFSTDEPGGLTVIGGNARKGFSGDGYSAITFDDNNTPTIGYLNSMGCWCSIGSSTTEGWSSYAAINTTSSLATNAGVGEQLIFYTPESNSSTSGTSGAGGYAVQLTPVNGNKFSLGKYLSYKVASAPSSGNVTIPSNGIVMFGKGTQNGAYVKGLKSGDVITVYLTPNLKDNAGNITKPEVTQALGGSMMILDGGTRISSYSNSLGNISGNEPRTAVGYNADKTKLVMLVVDGRNSGYTNGCNGKVLGDIMKNLGCSDALNFDGGGSSTFWTSSGGVINDTYNNNSGTGQIRSVADGLFIVKVATPVITTSASSVSLTTTNNAEVSKSITVSGSNLRGAINIALGGTNANQFSISSTSISQSAASGTITIKYKPTSFGTHSAKLTITSDAATTKTVTISGTNTEVVDKPDEPDEEDFDDRISSFTEVWNYSGNTTQASWLDITDGSSSGTTTRFIAENGGMLYVLNCKPYGTPVINILNAYTGVDTGNDVNLTGVSGGLTALSSIRFVDGILVGANAASTSHTFTVYAWKNGVGSAPTKILEDATHGGLIMGSNIAISGNLTNGRIWATDDGCKNVLYYTISNGTVNSTANIIALKDASGTQLELKGSRGASEVLPNEDGTFWVIGQSTYPYLFNASGTFVKSMNAGALNNNPYGTALKFFNYGKKQYSAAIAYTTGQTNGYFTLSNTTNGIDITVGYNCRYPINGLGANPNAQNMSSIAQSTRNNGKILDIWICCALQGVAHYSHNATGESVGVEEVTTAPEAAFVVNGSNLLATGIEVKEFSLYSINGAIVRTAQNSHSLNVEGLNGLYIAVAVDANGAIHTSKVAIR